jgi:hypothetical protein
MDQTEAQRRLAGMARHNLAHLAAGTIEQAPAVVRECERVFRRLPLVLALASAFPGEIG